MVNLLGYLGFVLVISIAVIPSPIDAQVTNSQTKRSGLDFVPSTVKKMQTDDSENPGQLWVLAGANQFKQDCQSCHATPFRGIAAAYPKWNQKLKRTINLEQRINQCRVDHLGRPPLPSESKELLELQAYLAHLSRGTTIERISNPDEDRLAQIGERLWKQPFGQLGISCQQCHNQYAGARLGGSLIPQGHANNYPSYRIQWQTIGSLQRRIRSCMTGVRAQAFSYQSEELLALEVFLRYRALGMQHEGVGVRP